jgi:hypothetical protein
MSVREVWTQSHFAELAYNNLDLKANTNTDGVFSSIHSFLSHCSMISKMLKAEADSLTIGDVLKVPDSSEIHNRRFRNHLEHYDERLLEWIRKKGVNARIATYNIGPKSMFAVPGIAYVSHYDPTTEIFTFIDEDLHLRPLRHEIVRIKNIADSWVQKLESARKTTP